MTDKETNLAELKALVIKFREDRGWESMYTPKDTAISISLEAAELLEHFQWEDYRQDNEAEIGAELADIIIFCLHFATLYDFDINTLIRAKLDKAAKKYPVEIFNKDTVNKTEYHRIKQHYRQAPEAKADDN